MEEQDSITAMEQLQSSEYFQRKLYFLLEQLKIMHSSLPE